jgi:hypothetical protein
MVIVLEGVMLVGEECFGVEEDDKLNLYEANERPP